MHRKIVLATPLLVVFFLISAAHSGPSADPLFSQEILKLGQMLDRSEYLEVLAQGQELLAGLQADSPDGSLDEAKVLDFLVNASYRSRNVMNPQAIVWGERAVALKDSLLGPGAPELANSLMHMGNLYSGRWESETAIPYYEQAVAILEKAGPDHDLKRAVILNSQGVAYRRAAQNHKSLELYAQAQAIQERLLGTDHPDVATTLNNMGVVFSERGDYAGSAALHRRALSIREKHFGPDSEWVAESANNLANQLGYLGQYQEALEVQERAVNILAKKLGTDHQRYWWAYMNLGITYQDMGDYTRAGEILEKVSAGLEKRYGPNHPNRCFALDALANNHHQMGQHEAALEMYTLSLNIAEAAYGKGSYDTADTIGQQGKCLIALGRLDEALERLNTSLEIWQESLDQENAMLCDLLNRIAELHLDRHDYTPALATAARSKMLAQRDLGNEHPLLAAAILLEARAQHGLGNDDLALDESLQAEHISHQHLHITMPVLSEQLALQYAGTRVDGLNLSLSLLADGEMGPRVERVWDALIQSRSSVLDEYVGRNRFLSKEEDPLTAALRDSTLMLRQQLANLTLRGPGWEDVEVYHSLLREAHQGIEAVERKLSLRSSRFRQWQASKEKGYADVVAAMPEGSALISFSRSTNSDDESSYQAFFLASAGAQPKFYDLGPADKIDAAVEAWRDQATFGIRTVSAVGREPVKESKTRGFIKVAQNKDDQIEAYRQAGTHLRQLIWDPLGADLGAAELVFVVADGSLNLVSFPALPLAEKSYLLESPFTIHILTAEKTLTEEQVRVKAKGRLVALGGANYSQEGTRAQENEATRNLVKGEVQLEFGSLPHAREEARQVSDIWAKQGLPTDLLTGSEATEAHLKSGLPGAQVVHLATHGFFLPRQKDSGLAGRWDNPLTRSGLALAGANDWQEHTSGSNDGILTAQEVSAMNLTGVKWAVLSACDTGLGELDTRGEGVFGLRRAFALAGAETVIMSLWSVDDESTHQWMDALYTARWEEGASTAQAVRQASQQVLDQRRQAGLSDHPYYWAGFTAAGHWQ